MNATAIRALGYGLVVVSMLALGFGLGSHYQRQRDIRAVMPIIQRLLICEDILGSMLNPSQGESEGM